jgi:hypothetical protein
MRRRITIADLFLALAFAAGIAAGHGLVTLAVMLLV